MIESERWLSTGQVARELECSVVWVGVLLSRELLVYRRTALGRLVDAESVAEYKRARAERRQRRELAESGAYRGR